MTEIKLIKILYKGRCPVPSVLIEHGSQSFMASKNANSNHKVIAVTAKAQRVDLQLVPLREQMVSLHIPQTSFSSPKQFGATQAIPFRHP